MGQLHPLTTDSEQLGYNFSYAALDPQAADLSRTISAMLVYAGIDEAGYGPMFGPLCIACSAFCVRDCDNVDAPPPNLWGLLNRTTCRKPNDARRRIAVDDSKKLKGSASRARHPLADLERGVLAFCSTITGAGETIPATCTELLHRLDPGRATQQLDEYPWYESHSALPVAGDANLLRIDAARLRRSMHDTAVRCSSIRCSVVDVGAFNRGVRTFGNKAGVNLHHALRHVEHIRKSHSNANFEIIIDRQGGRTHYRRQLQDFWPNARLKIEDETDQASRYILTLEPQQLAITFIRRAEESHLPVALASMTAKYVRELLMLRLNRYFRSVVPELKPTAGYVQDGRRFLKDIEPILRRFDHPRSQLVREC